MRKEDERQAKTWLNKIESKHPKGGEIPQFLTPTT